MLRKRRCVVPEGTLWDDLDRLRGRPGLRPKGQQRRIGRRGGERRAAIVPERTRSVERPPRRAETRPLDRVLVRPNAGHLMPLFRPFEHGRSRHRPSKKMADRAVRIELKRFLAGIHAIWETPDKREVGSSTERPLGASSVKQRPRRGRCFTKSTRAHSPAIGSNPGLRSDPRSDLTDGQVEGAPTSRDPRRVGFSRCCGRTAS